MGEKVGGRCDVVHGCWIYLSLAYLWETWIVFRARIYPQRESPGGTSSCRQLGAVLGAALIGLQALPCPPQKVAVSCSRATSASVCDAAEDEIASAAGETTLRWTGCRVLWWAARRLLVVPMDGDDVTWRATWGEELRTERVSWRRATVVDVE